MSIAELAKSFRNSLKRQAPEILTGIGIAGMISGSILAVKATPKALMLIDKKKKEAHKKEISKKEIIKTTWKCYIPSFSISIISIMCIIGASAVNTQRNAALATAYSLSESALKLYREKVLETIGEKEEQKIRDKVSEEKLKQNSIITKEVILTEKGNTLCFDSISGRYFKSDIETIKQAINEINRKMLNEVYISLNDFYDEIGLSPTKIGYQIGWSSDKGLIKVSYSSQLADNGTPCLVIDFIEMPKYDFDK